MGRRVVGFSKSREHQYVDVVAAEAVGWFAEVAYDDGSGISIPRLSIAENACLVVIRVALEVLGCVYRPLSDRSRNDARNRRTESKALANFSFGQ